MKRKGKLLAIRFLPQMPRLVFILLMLVVSSGFTIMGLMTGQFQKGLFGANLSVQRPFGQIILLLPIVGVLTFLLVKLLKNTSLLLRIGSRVSIARQILHELSVYTLAVTVVVWGIWFGAVLLFSQVGQGVMIIAANLNLMMNVATALFIDTLLTLFFCLAFRSQAVGISLGLGVIIVFYIAPSFGLDAITNLITPKLTQGAMWPIDIVKQWLLVVIAIELMTITLMHIRLPIKV
ncbi:hypothetical protein [Lacticaseibacillus zeae]|uniref:ABC transporter permease n=1 Tax=Lacticaseibacillus zeae subsp. silagei TaxID=3068307 RepID=A0ABD7ZAD3_LACZE|nr:MULTISPECIES: hypothetical protein [Lacticaseibacillus]MDE3316345.1 hypothetical protein [Lacticaseibacillus zeae]WLV83870.1 hypothetical protein LACZS2_000261 [Lacticaseibacillus sp. NCIMB 15475]WLV86626.1 hypothetical protein LACZS1_000261 [Lacticaseibacillus sp. NCIMB 15474]